MDYHGVRCEFNVYAPNVTQPQYSMGEMIIQSFEDQIQVGWIVSYFLFSFLIFFKSRKKCDHLKSFFIWRTIFQRGTIVSTHMKSSNLISL